MLGVAAAWGAALSGGILAGCGPAAPTKAAQRVTLLLQAAAQGSYAFASPAEWPQASRLLYDATSAFRAKHPSVDLRFWGTTANPVAEVIAGTGPDIVQLQGGQGAVGTWVDSGLLVDLEPYVRKANLDLKSTFASSALAVARNGASLYAFPYYSETMAMAVNEDALDAIGVAYPPPDWDYKQWAQWSREVAAALRAKGASSSAPRFATTVATIFGGPVPAGFYFHGWGGGIVDMRDRTRSLLDTPESVACGEFLYGLLLEGVAQPAQLIPPAFVAGRQIAAADQQGFVMRDALNLRAVKWAYYPMPRWPRGAYDFTNENLVGINAATKNVEAAWELLAFICASAHYQRALMHLFLYPPALKSLWSEWVAEVHAVAPPLKGKHVEVFTARMQDNLLVPVYGGSFSGSDAQAMNIVTNYCAQILARKVDVPGAFAAITHEVNKLELRAAQHQTAAKVEQARYPARGPTIATVAPGR